MQPRTTESWVNMNGVPDREGKLNTVNWRDVLLSEVVPDLEGIRLRNPDEFVAGGIHRNPGAWEPILREHPFAEEISKWIRNKVNILQFSQPFAGSYKGSYYDSDLPPPKHFAFLKKSQSAWLRVQLECGDRLELLHHRTWYCP